ncbi:MAG: hypothetical protein K2N58_02555 [Treponemataceae bacterium]|nr:hypothetical protein [Treponemataceae bacterium]
MPRSSRVLFAFALILCVSPLFSQEIPVEADRIVKIAEPVKTICWNHDDSLFALGEADSIIVRDAQSLDILHDFLFPQEMNLCFSREEGSSEEFYNDMILGVSSEYMAIWSLPQDAKNAPTDFGYSLSFGESQEVVCAAFSEDSDLIAVAFSDGSGMLYFKLRGAKKFDTTKLEGGTRNVHNLAFSPNSSLVAAASSDGLIYVWDTVDGALISEIDSFVGMRTPVAFSADSKSVYGCIEENVVSLMAFNGNVLREVRVQSTVSQFTVTSDDKTLIVLTDDGLLEFYSLESGRLLGYIPPFNDSQLISFAFNSDYSQVLTGHQDGSVYKLLVEDVLRKPDEPVPETPVFDAGAFVVVSGQEHAGSASGASGQPVYVPFNFQSALREHFHAFNVGASAIMLDKKSNYYQFGTAAEFGWYTTMFTAPVYEGLGARFAMAFPADNYPTTYKTLDGSARIAPPYLFFGEVLVPVGVEVPVSTFVSLFSEVAFEAKVSWLMNPGVTSSKQAFSLGGRIRTGIIISKLAVMLGAEYDSMWGLIPEIAVTANFKLKGKNKDKGGKK